MRPNGACLHGGREGEIGARREQGKGNKKRKSLIQEKKTATRLRGSGIAEISRLRSYRSILERCNLNRFKPVRV